MADPDRGVIEIGSGLVRNAHIGDSSTGAPGDLGRTECAVGVGTLGRTTGDRGSDRCPAGATGADGKGAPDGTSMPELPAPPNPLGGVVSYTQGGA